MFVAAPDLTHVEATPDRVAAVIESINQPAVAVPGRDTEPTSAAIVGVRNANGTFSAYIHLHLITSNSAAVYVFEPRQIPLAHYAEVEAEAVQFVESMGFMVDNLNFRRQTKEQQALIVGRLPAFHADLARFAPKAAVGGESGDELEELEALDAVEELEPEAASDELETLEAIEPMGSAEPDLPVVQAEFTTIMEMPDLEAVDNAFSNMIETPPPLDPKDRERLGRLLAAF